LTLTLLDTIYHMRVLVYLCDVS